MNYTPTSQRLPPDVERVENIFIHRDVDAGTETPQPLTDSRIERINNELAGLIAGGTLDTGVEAVGNDVAQVYIDRDKSQQEPVLRIEIRKRGTENDPPYELRINEMRRVIRERYGVDVRKATVDGTFEY